MSEAKTDAAGNDLAAGKVFMVKAGIFNGWVCAPKSMDMAAVQEGVDGDVFPAGTTAGWRVEQVDSEDEGLRSPGRCAESSDRQHWCVVC